jgi:hypothetical protein
MRIRDWGLALLLVLALTVSSAAIPGDTLWTRFYGSPDGEVAYAFNSGYGVIKFKSEVRLVIYGIRGKAFFISALWLFHSDIKHGDRDFA